MKRVAVCGVTACVPDQIKLRDNNGKVEISITVNSVNRGAIVDPKTEQIEHVANYLTWLASGRNLDDFCALTGREIN